MKLKFFTLINYDKEQIRGTGHGGFSSISRRGYFVENTFPQKVNGNVLMFDLQPCHSWPATSPGGARIERGMINAQCVCVCVCLLCTEAER